MDFHSVFRDPNDFPPENDEHNYYEGNLQGDNTRLVEIALNYNNYEFTTFVSKTVLKALKEDTDLLDSYAKQVFEREFLGRKNVSNEPGTSQPESEPQDEPFNQPSVESSCDKFQSTPRSTKLLIETRLSMEKDFIKPVCSKKKLWKKIADVLEKNNYKVTETMCDMKYRNLLHTYRTNKKKQKTTGEGIISWEYFEKFDQVLGHKDSSQPSEVNLNSSFAILESTEESEDENFGNNGNTMDEHSQNMNLETPNQSQNRKRKLEILSMGRYLFFKNKRSEESAEKKEKYRKMKWEEEKDLKKQEIEALNRLAEAIKGSNN